MSEQDAVDEGDSTGGAAGIGEETAADGPLTGLYALQRAPRRRRVAAGVGLLVGLALSTLHWGGLLVGGALVGLAMPTLRRALAAGLGFGVLVLVVAGARIALAGTLGAVLGTWPLVAVGVVAPLVAGPLGALVRGLVPDAPLDGERP